MNPRTGTSARRGRRVAITSTFAALCLLSARLDAQSGSTFARGIVVHGDWLQANAMPLGRNAFQSAGADLSFRAGGWAADGGWLRVARKLSTVQGSSLSLGRMWSWNRVLFIPAVGGFLGRAQRSVDSTGFDFVDPATGVAGHTPRYSYSSATSIGGGGGLSVEIPLYRALAARGTAWQWYFGGAPLDGDRARTVLGAGLSIRLSGGR
jgi:hypothetical protein